MINKVFNDDIFNVMKKVEDNSVDLIITDPPYNTTSCKWEWDIMSHIENFWSESKRILKKDGAIIIFGSQPFTSKIICSNLNDFKYEIIWHKNQSGGFVSAKKRIMKYHENIMVFYENQPTYNPQMEEYSDSMKERYKKGGTKKNKKDKNEIQNIKTIDHEININKGRYPQSVQFYKRPHTANGASLHPTQKPLELIKYLVRTFSNENDLIFDGFMGSGTTAVAAKALNRNYIGSELDKDYYEIINKRLSAVQGSLF